uniref:Uncharacterized protein n=1 Tax=Phlebotomus papatasi TaxID=29031 RepID=A0A1B0D8K5_PHLPP
MKYHHALIFLTCAVAVYCQTYTGLGRIVPGQNVLGFSENSTSITITPQDHSVQLTFYANPGIDITFVHVNIFPTWSSLGYTVPGQINMFQLTVYMYNITQLKVDLVVYGMESRCFTGGRPMESPKMVTITNLDSLD